MYLLCLSVFQIVVYAGSQSRLHTSAVGSHIEQDNSNSNRVRQQHQPLVYTKTNKDAKKDIFMQCSLTVMQSLPQ